MGDVIADAQLDATNDPGFGEAVVAFMNPGGIRADLIYASSPSGEGDGNVTYREMFTVQPFGNSMVTMTITGAQIDTLLEQQFVGCGQSSNRILQVSQGFSYTWSASGGACNKVDPSTIKLNGVTVDPGASYRVTVNSFLADGGDNFLVLKEGTDRLGGEVDTDAFEKYFAAFAGEGCPRCQGRLEAARGIEVGHIFKLGTKYSVAMGCRFLDAEGKSRPVIMGCYGIGVTRMAAAWIEQNHDAKGIIWGPQVAPFHAHLIGLNLEVPSVNRQAEEIYQKLQQGGVDVLFDDRPARAGEKFSDADLIGLPVRQTVSQRTMEEGKVEYKRRRDAKPEVITFDEALERIRAECVAASA